MKTNTVHDKIESLEIKIRHLENDYILTREENEISTQKYLEILSELKDKNKKLQDFQKNLERTIEKRTKELHESQKILQEKSKEQEIILDSSPVMIFYKDLENRFVRVNKSFAEFISIPFNEIIGKSNFELVPDKSEQLRKEDQEIIKTGKSKLNIQGYFDTPNGKRWILTDKIPYRDLNGNIKGIIGFSLDITERKHLEEQLLQSEKLASVGQLVAGVAHELNNPLAIISGYSELMKTIPYLEEKDKKMLDKIIKGVKRCSAIVENLLKFSRKTEIKKTNIKINDVIFDALSMRENQFKVDNIMIIKDFSTILPITVGDQNQLQSVFFNLANNAYDAMYEVNKKGTLLVKTYQERNFIIVEFIDDGPGVPVEHQNKIFDPFFTTKEVGKGTGLGLSLCYGIINEHGGQLYFDKSYTKGARFVIKIPIVKPLSVKVPEVKTFDLPIKANILVIDDEPEILDIQRSVLESYEYYKVDAVTSGEEGFALIEKNNYDLIISDVKMPGKMDGEDVYWKVKAKDEKIAKRIIFITGDISDEIRTFLEKYNILHIRKPFRIKDYLAVVSEALNRKS